MLGPYVYRCLFLLAFLPLFPGPVIAGNASCPYDIDPALVLIPPACYTNATTVAQSPMSCCWMALAAFFYAATANANRTGVAFLPDAAASACRDAFSGAVLSRGLVRPGVLSGGSCDVGDLAAGSRPCLFASLAALRSPAGDLSNATSRCTGDLSGDPPACAACQNEVLIVTAALLKFTNSEEFVPCGMATTMGIWSAFSPPPVDKFRSYVLCMIQILENANASGTNLFPGPIPLSSAPTSPDPPPRSVSGSRSAIIAAVSASIAAAALALALALAVKIRSSSAVRSAPDGDLSGAGGELPLPTDGLYLFTAAEIRAASNGYDDRLLLGEGGAGKVYLGKLPSGQHVAIKRFYRDKKLGEFYREVEVLAKLRHKNLTTLVGYCVGNGEHAVVYEYMAGGNLSRALFHGELTWLRRVRIAVDIAEGLAYLHELGDGAVVHRDVKPTNVLLADGECGPAKLSDFGVSRIVPIDGSDMSTEVRGTAGYLDPESLALGHVSEATDVYSFGVVLLELVTGKTAVVPTPTGGAESLVHAAQSVAMVDGSDGRDELESMVDPRLGAGWERGSVGAVFELACRCVRPHKGERPRMTEALAALKAVLTDLEGTGTGSDVAQPRLSILERHGEVIVQENSGTAEHHYRLRGASA